jgi:hypothetical protein
MKLEANKIYETVQGDKVLIKKELWDCWFMAYSVNNGVFMGRYEDNGGTVEGLHELHDIVRLV